jgi:hypothetical protein
MIRIATFVKGLIRRVKKHMAAVVVGVGIFSATSGLYVILEHSQYKIWGLIFGILGIILVLIGYILSYVQDIVLSANDWLDVVREPRDTAKIEIATEPRPILRLHHPKPTPPKLPRLGRNEFYAGDGMTSRRYFRGAKRRKLC